VKKTEVEFQRKVEKPAGKKLEDLNMDRASTKNDSNNEYILLYDSHKNLQNFCLNSKLKVHPGRDYPFPEPQYLVCQVY
jgi:hypothetical protein